MPNRVSIHNLFLPGGLLLLAMGTWGLYNYFHLKGPADAELHELPLREIKQVTVEPDIPGSAKIDRIWLQTSNDVRIRYRNRFPYSTQVRFLDAGCTLLLDGTNAIWGIKTSDGEIHGRSYFEEYNIEAKSVGKYCGGFLAAFGAVMLLVYFAIARTWPGATEAERARLEVDGNRLYFILSLVGYLILYSTLLAPWLSKFLPGFLVSVLWVVSGGVLMGFIGRKWPPTR